MVFILFTIVFSISVNGQPDTTETSGQIKEAPAFLKKLLSEAEAAKSQQVSSDADIEIDGLLVDGTKTRSGRDFYDYFYRDWEPPDGAKNYSITISEKPYRLNTTQVEVSINETLVFQSFLQPRGDIIEMLAQQAVAQTWMYLKDYEAIVKQLEGDDRSGNGIF